MPGEEHKHTHFLFCYCQGVSGILFANIFEPFSFEKNKDERQKDILFIFLWIKKSYIKIFPLILLKKA